MRGRSASAALAVGALTLSLTACDSGTAQPAASLTTVPTAPLQQQTGEQVLHAAAAALSSARAVHVTGTATDIETRKPITADIQLQTDRTRAFVTTPIGDLSIIKTGRVTYLKSFAFYLTLAGVSENDSARLANRWVRLDSDDTGDSYSLRGMARELSNSEGLTIAPSVSRTLLDGRPVLVVRKSDGSAIYVAAMGKPYPLKAVIGSGTKANPTGPGEMRFDDYDKPITINAPTGAVDAPTVKGDDPNSLISIS